MEESSGQPQPPLATSTTLLEGLRDPANHTVWLQYVERYRPLMVGYARRLGVPVDGAEDVAQNALLAFATAYRGGRYERSRSRLSSWLFGIVTNEVRSWLRRQRREPTPVPPGTGELERLPADDELEELWYGQWRAAVLRACLRQVRGEIQPTTMQAFERFALKGRPAQEVASELGLSANAVFGAKRRVVQRLRELLPFMQENW